jgi:hypothetical protein
MISARDAQSIAANAGRHQRREQTVFVNTLHIGQVSAIGTDQFHFACGVHRAG